MKLGESIEQNPIIHAIGKATGCVDPETNRLRPESNCAKARDRLNNGELFFSVMWDRFFERREKGEKMKVVIQLAVEVDRVSSIDLKAIEASCNGEVLSTNPRPTPTTQVQRPPILQPK